MTDPALPAQPTWEIVECHCCGGISGDPCETTGRRIPPAASTIAAQRAAARAARRRAAARKTTPEPATIGGER